jgi:primary-amine oxidase
MLFLNTIASSESLRLLNHPRLKCWTSEKTGKSAPYPAGIAMVQLYLDTVKDHWQLKADLSTRHIVDKQSLAGKHSYTAAADMQGSEAACLAGPRVQEEICALHLPEEAVVCVEPWAYGTD